MRPLLPALLAAAIVVAGCQESEQDQVRSAITSFIRSYADGDAAAVCAKLTPEIKKAYDGGCEAGIQNELDALSAGDKQRLRSLKVTKVAVSGDRATARLEGQGGNPGSLRKLGGEWLVENQ